MGCVGESLYTSYLGGASANVLVDDADADAPGTGVVEATASTTGITVARLQPTDEIISVACSSAVDVIAAGAADKAVRVWKVGTGSP